jgi:hypothetical protein
MQHSHYLLKFRIDKSLLVNDFMNMCGFFTQATKWDLLCNEIGSLRCPPDRIITVIRAGMISALFSHLFCLPARTRAAFMRAGSVIVLTY